MQSLKKQKTMGHVKFGTMDFNRVDDFDLNE